MLLISRDCHHRVREHKQHPNTSFPVQWPPGLTEMDEKERPVAAELTEMDEKWALSLTRVRPPAEKASV